MAVKIFSILVACTFILHLVTSASLQNKSCMCYVRLYDCDIDCVGEFETEFEIHECMGVCVRDYVTCRERCNGESFNIKFPHGIKRSVPARR